MSEDGPEVTVTWWTDIREFIGLGISREFVTDLKSEHFSHFTFMLRTLHSEPFNEAAELVDGDVRIAVATPKPEGMHFESECFKCEEEIPKNEIHFEVEGDGDMVYLCRHCFFSAPYEE
jgi:hypothetical protein